MKTTLALVFSLFLCLPQNTFAAIISFSDQATFLATTGATAEAPLVNFDFSAAPKTIGDLTYSLNGGSNFGIGEFSTRISGPEIIVSGPDGIAVDINKASPVFSFGFEFVEPQNDPNLNGTFVDSTYSLEILNGTTGLGSFNFNAPNDTLAFVGIQSDQAFDRVLITEIIGSNGNEFYGQFFTGGAAAVPEPSTYLLLLFALVGIKLYKE